MRSRGNDPRVIRVPDNDVRVISGHQFSLACTKSENLSRIGGNKLCEPLQGYSPALYTMGEQECQPVLDSPGAIWNLREIINSNIFLPVKVEGTMICRHHVDGAIRCTEALHDQVFQIHIPNHPAKDTAGRSRRKP